MLCFTADCSKDEHWDQRYYIENVPQYGKVVRPCSPGTVYSKRYCACIVNENGLFPILPGGKLYQVVVFVRIRQWIKHGMKHRFESVS